METEVSPGETSFVPPPLLLPPIHPTTSPGALRLCTVDPAKLVLMLEKTVSKTWSSLS